LTCIPPSQASGLDSNAKRRLQASQIRSYFYGGPSVSFGALAPHSMSIPFPILSINRIGEDAFVPLSALPIGHTRSIQDTQLTELNPMDPDGNGQLMNRLCALPQVESARRYPMKKRKRTASPVNGAVEVANVTREASQQPRATSTIPSRQGSVQPDATVAVPAAPAPTEPEVSAGAGPSVKQEEGTATEQEAPATVVKREENETVDSADAPTDQDTNGLGTEEAKQENKPLDEVAETAEQKEQQGNVEEDDPYADYTEEEKQQLVEDAIEDSEVACSPILGFVHM
jgi:hypothetical protein